MTSAPAACIPLLALLAFLVPSDPRPASDTSEAPLTPTSTPLPKRPPSTQRGERWPRPDQRLEGGPLVIDVYISETAHRAIRSPEL